MNTSSFAIVGSYGAGHLTKRYSIQYEQESIIMTESGIDYKNIYYFVFNHRDVYYKHSGCKQKYWKKNPFYIENITTSDIEFVKLLINIIAGQNYECGVTFSELFEKISDCIKYYVINKYYVKRNNELIKRIDENKIIKLEKENNELVKRIDELIDNIYNLEKENNESKNNELENKISKLEKENNNLEKENNELKKMNSYLNLEIKRYKIEKFIIEIFISLIFLIIAFYIFFL